MLGRITTRLVLAALVVGGCAGGVPAATQSRSPAASTIAAASPVPMGSPDPTASPAPTACAIETGSSVADVISLDADFYSVTAGPEGVWLLSPTGRVIRIDPATNTVAAEIRVPVSEFGNIALGGGSVWVTDASHNSLLRLDPKTKKVTAIKVGDFPEGLLYALDHVWVSNHHGGSVSKIDPRTNEAATYEFTNVGESGPKGLAAVDGDIWTTVPTARSLFRIDGKTGESKGRIELTYELTSPFTDGRYVYVIYRNHGEQLIARVDPSANEAVPDFEPADLPIAAGLDSLWSVADRTLIRLDPATLARTGSWCVIPGDPPMGVTTMAFDDESVWLATDGRTLVRVRPGS